MVNCIICGKYCKNLAGLSGHIQFKHPGYKLQSTKVSKRQKINQETHLPHHQSYQPPQETYPLYQERIQDITVNNNYQNIPDIQRRQSIFTHPPSLIQEIEHYKKILKLIDELKQHDKNIPNPEIERINRKIEPLELILEKINSTKEKLVKDSILNYETIVRNKREENLEIENVAKKTQENIRDSPSSFSSQSDKKFHKEQQRGTEKIEKALNNLYNTKLELKQYEWEVKHGNPIVDEFIVGGLNQFQQIMELQGNKSKKQEINPSPKRVTLKPFKKN